MPTLKIKDLHVSVDDKEILKGVDLTVASDEIHALMGPNGNGKSTLLMTIMGHPRYQVTKGSIEFDGQDVLKMSVDARSRAGLFLGMQYPMEIPGVTNSDFMKAAVNARRTDAIPLFSFIRQFDGALQQVGLKSEMAHRFLNEGFSGGEKKRNEIVQMKLLKPSLAMLDEIDSGLDVDALKVVAENILSEHQQNHTSLIIVSHYERFYDLVKPTHAHVMVDGKLIEHGGYELVEKIDHEGYEWLLAKHGLTLQQPQPEARISLESCAANPQVRKHG